MVGAVIGVLAGVAPVVLLGGVFGADSIAGRLPGADDAFPQFAAAPAEPGEPLPTLTAGPAPQPKSSGKPPRSGTLPRQERPVVARPVARQPVMYEVPLPDRWTAPLRLSVTADDSRVVIRTSEGRVLVDEVLDRSQRLWVEPGDIVILSYTPELVRLSGGK